MLSKAHNPSGRLVRGRIACLIVVLSTLACAVLGAANAYAAAPLTSVIGNVTAATTSAADGALAPVAKAATQGVSASQNPATNAATPAPAVTVAPLGKPPVPDRSGAVVPLPKVTPQGAASAVTPLANAAAQSAGHVVEPVGKVVTRALTPAVEGAGRVLSSIAGLTRPATANLDRAGSGLTSVLAGAGAALPVSLPPATSGAESLISAPQGAPAALRGAIGVIGALGDVLWSAASSDPAARALELLGSSLSHLAVGLQAERSAPATLAQVLPAAVMAAVLGAQGGAGGSTSGLGRYGAPGADAGTQAEASSGRFAGPPGCALSRLPGQLAELCGAGQPPRMSSPSRPPLGSGAAAGPARATRMAGGAPGRSGGARAGPVAQGLHPSPAPGAASGSAAGSGFAVSVFLTLAGLLLLAAPCALRRLALSCEPWLQARFVLIPERPG
jgi:hypothetical protein